MKFKYIMLAIVFCFSITKSFSQPDSLPEYQPCELLNPIGWDINPDHQMVKPVIPYTHPPNSSPPDDNHRIIYWLHGLGGTNLSWSNVGLAIQDSTDNKAISLFPDFTELNLHNSGIDLHNTLGWMGNPDIQQYSIDPKRNFIIAHSLGGLVSRSAYQYETDLSESEKRFGGIVTFGTPHQGAQILADSTLILDFTEDACNALKAGPAAELFTGNWFIDLVANGTSFEQKLDNVCRFLSDQVVPFVIKDLLSDITADITPTAPAIQELNNFEPDNTDDQIHKVAFYGIEEDPVSWRTVQYFINKPEAFPLYSCDSDTMMVNWANREKDKYYAHYIMYNALYASLTNDGCTGLDWLGGFLLGTIPLPTPSTLNAFNPCIVYDIYDNIFNLDGAFGTDENDAMHIRDAYYEGWQWWVNEENYYKALIGAIEEVEVQVTTYECTCWHTTGGNEDELDGIDIFSTSTMQVCGSQSGGNTQCEITDSTNVTIINIIENPSDGVVLQESAMNFSGANYVKEMDKSNHQQMRNDSNTELRLEELLYDGTYGDFFITE